MARCATLQSAGPETAAKRVGPPAQKSPLRIEPEFGSRRRQGMASSTSPESPSARRCVREQQHRPAGGPARDGQWPSGWGGRQRCCEFGLREVAVFPRHLYAVTKFLERGWHRARILPEPLRNRNAYRGSSPSMRMELWGHTRVHVLPGSWPSRARERCSARSR